jgi:hypothetical protein
VASPLPEGSLPSIIQLSKSFSRNPRVALVTDASRPPLSIQVVNTLASEPSAQALLIRLWHSDRVDLRQQHYGVNVEFEERQR